MTKLLKRASHRCVPWRLCRCVQPSQSTCDTTQFLTVQNIMPIVVLSCLPWSLCDDFCCRSSFCLIKISYRGVGRGIIKSSKIRCSLSVEAGQNASARHVNVTYSDLNRKKSREPGLTAGQDQKAIEMLTGAVTPYVHEAAPVSMVSTWSTATGSCT